MVRQYSFTQVGGSEIRGALSDREDLKPFMEPNFSIAEIVERRIKACSPGPWEC